MSVFINDIKFPGLSATGFLNNNIIIMTAQPLAETIPTVITLEILNRIASLKSLHIHRMSAACIRDEHPRRRRGEGQSVRQTLQN